MTTTLAPATGELVDALVDRVSAIDWTTLDASTRASTRALVLDALGLAAAAPRAPSLTATADAQRRLSGTPAPGTGLHLPFVGDVAGPANTAAALSVAIHAWDFDDTHDTAVVHTACVALPAALAAAQECGADGRRVLEGVLAGVEVLARLSLALGPQPGVIRTAGLGGLAAAAAAGRVLGLDADRMRSALALALPTALSPTSRQVVVDSAVNKRHQPSLAVHGGLSAAYLAAAGVEGPPGWWSGEHGLARAVPDPGAAAAHLDTPGWEIDRVSLKPIPACRYAHAAVAGVLELTDARPLAIDDVPEVTVHLPVGSTHVMVARPFERRGLPIVDAQFSVPWLVAAALLGGGVGLPEMTPRSLLDADIEQVARRHVRVVQDQDPADSVMTPVVVEAAGRSVVVDRLPGSPERPLTPEQQQAKLRGCLEVAGRPAEDAAVLTALVSGLENQPASALGDALRAATPAPTSSASPTSPAGGTR